MSLSKILFATLSMAVLSACAQVDDIDQGLTGLKGRPVAPVLRALGKPSKQWAGGGKTVYAWSNAETAPSSHRDCEDTYGGARSMTCGSFAPASQTAYCIVQITADKTGTVIDAFRDGPPRACGKFARRLPK